MRGDIVVVDNCLIHIKGNTTGLQDFFTYHHILMIALPPYHPYLNPKEVVFQTLYQRISSLQARYNSYSEANFRSEIIAEIICFALRDVLSFYL